MDLPKEVGRKFKPFDWYGWLMATTGLILLCKFGGIGWVFGDDKNWWLFSAVFVCFWEYAIRIIYGRVYKFVYYDTIIHPLYEIDIDGKIFFINAETEEDLLTYMDIHYPSIDYEVTETHTETFIRTDNFM